MKITLKITKTAYEIVKRFILCTSIPLQVQTDYQWMRYTTRKHLFFAFQSVFILILVLVNLFYFIRIELQLVSGAIPNQQQNNNLKLKAIVQKGENR